MLFVSEAPRSGDNERVARVTAIPFARRAGGRSVDASGVDIYNASGVVQVADATFVFVDNHDPGALYEITLGTDGRVSAPVRRALTGLEDGDLSDPEGLARIDLDDEIHVIAASSLGRTKKRAHDGLVRVRYAADGDLEAEAMPGFRDWVITEHPALAEAAATRFDDGGLNIEGLAWDPTRQMLLFGLRSPAAPDEVLLLQVHLDTGAPWTTAALTAAPSVTLTTAKSEGAQGIRDITYDTAAAEFLILLGGAVRRKDGRFMLCRWDGTSPTLTDCHVDFERHMKPEGIVVIDDEGTRRALIVDDAGGYAVVDLN